MWAAGAERVEATHPDLALSACAWEGWSLLGVGHLSVLSALGARLRPDRGPSVSQPPIKPVLGFQRLQ